MKESWSAGCQSVLLRAKDESLRLEHHFLGTEHLLLAMLMDDSSLLCRILLRLSVDPGVVEESILKEIVPSSVIRRGEGFPLSPRVRSIVVEAERASGEQGLDSIEEDHLLSALLRGGYGVGVRALERCGLQPTDLLRFVIPGLAVDRAAPDAMGQTRPSALRPPSPDRSEDPTRPGGRAAPSPADIEPDPDEAPTRPGRLAPRKPAPTRAEKPEAPRRSRTPERPSVAPEAPAPATPKVAEKPRPSKETTGKWHQASGRVPVMPMGGNPVLFDMGVIKTPAPQPMTPTLDKIGRDLTELARQGKLGPVVGRDEEIEELTRSLCRASRNNPLLLGEPGVGKTTIVEGLAIDVVQGNVPPQLLGVRIVEIPLATITADTKFRGELEDRLIRLVEEARDHNTILVIDEVHTLVTGARAESPTDAATIIKPYLSRGEIRVIGTTSPKDLSWLERDAALARCFHVIKVEEPSDACLLELLQDFGRRFGAFHNVHVTEEALETLVRLVREYVKDRRMPDAAIDVLDEACVRSVEIASGPKSRGGTTSSRKPRIGAEHIAAVIAARTGIPAEALTLEEKARMASMEDDIRKTLVGQDEAIHRVCERIRMYKAGFREERRPLGVFLFLGPTGVGKTELARSISKFLFNSDEKLHKFDMSEFMDGHEVSKLIGSPPGYVGYGEDGQLTGAVRRDPHCVVLLDEIEKAHPKVFDLFLQVFDDGRLTDGKGVTTDFSHAIIILTSNLGADLWKDKKSIGLRQKLETDEGARRQRMIDQLKGPFRPEFLNRLDDILLFRPLDETQIERIAGQIIGRWQERSERQGHPFRVSDEVLAFLCKKGYDADLGARPMKRAVEQHLMQPLSREILSGAIQPGQMIEARLDGDHVVFDDVT